MPLKNPYTISPAAIKPGDVFAFTVTFHIMNRTEDSITVNMYRCPYPNADLDYGVPQGDRISTKDGKAILRALMPTLLDAAKRIIA